ncbi:MAG: heme biosynthesis HemY N-terminal domain-containing protein, partial [Rubrivivax sp.]|nr:heme biosynthesis HemY N-terminal domain-containing protein [Rubrivivax sp.]
MRGIVWLILLFVAAVVAATTLGSNDGLVTLYWSGWRVDLSLNLFVLLLVGTCVAVMVAVQALNSMLTLPQRASQWRALRRERGAQAALREAQSEYFSARYSRAHKAARRALDLQQGSDDLRGDAEFTVLAHVLAAGSLHRLQDRTQRDALMQSLLSRGLGGDDGARLLAAEWALDDRDAEQALRLLAELPPGVARRTQALRLKLQAARMARQPLDALHTARMLANHQAFSADAARSLLRSLAAEVLDGSRDIEQLRRLWTQLDDSDRRDPHVAARAALRAALHDAHEEGRQWLRPFWDRLTDLDRDQRQQVALALMAATPGLGNDWLARLEGAAKSFSHEPAILAAVGIAYAERQLWGKARPLLEQAGAASALPSAPRRQAWRVLARLARGE